MEAIGAECPVQHAYDYQYDGEDVVMQGPGTQYVKDLKTLYTKQGTWKFIYGTHPSNAYQSYMEHASENTRNTQLDPSSSLFNVSITTMGLANADYEMSTLRTMTMVRRLVDRVFFNQELQSNTNAIAVLNVAQVARNPAIADTFKLVVKGVGVCVNSIFSKLINYATSGLCSVYIGLNTEVFLMTISNMLETARMHTNSADKYESMITHWPFIIERMPYYLTQLTLGAKSFDLTPNTTAESDKPHVVLARFWTTILLSPPQSINAEELSQQSEFTNLIKSFMDGQHLNSNGKLPHLERDVLKLHTLLNRDANIPGDAILYVYLRAMFRTLLCWVAQKYYAVPAGGGGGDGSPRGDEPLDQIHLDDRRVLSLVCMLTSLSFSYRYKNVLPQVSETDRKIGLHQVRTHMRRNADATLADATFNETLRPYYFPCINAGLTDEEWNDTSWTSGFRGITSTASSSSSAAGFSMLGPDDQVRVPFGSLVPKNVSEELVSSLKRVVDNSILSGDYGKKNMPPDVTLVYKDRRGTLKYAYGNSAIPVGKRSALGQQLLDTEDRIIDKYINATEDTTKLYINLPEEKKREDARPPRRDDDRARRPRAAHGGDSGIPLTQDEMFGPADADEPMPQAPMHFYQCYFNHI